MIRKAFAALCGLAVLASGPAHGQAQSDVWLVHIAGTESVIFVDTARIEQRAGSVRRAWSWDFYAPENSTSKIVALGDYDCAERRFRGLQMTRYPRQGANITSPAEADWSYVIPETAVDHVHRFVCATDAERDANANYAQLSAQRRPMTMEQAAAALFYVR